MSPGFCAAASGRFSDDGTKPRTRWRGFSSGRMEKRPRTAAPPHMSYFISSIFLPGFREMPPESKVSPLPTTATVSRAPFGAYSRQMSFASWAEPRATPSRAFIPSLCICASPRTRTFTPPFANRFAWLARWVGVQTLPGRLARSRARQAPRASRPPKASPSWAQSRRSSGTCRHSSVTGV